MSRVVVIGGVAAGMSAASQVKRRQPDTEVIALERGPYVSYGACGMPYNIEDADRDIEEQVVFTPERFREERNIDVRTGHEVVAIDTAAKSLRVNNIEEDQEYDLTYDSLVIATGASAFRPPIEGLDTPGVFVLRELTDGAMIKDFMVDNPPQKAVIVGAGYIGLEMADAFTKRGLTVEVLEMMDQAVPGWHPQIPEAGKVELEKHEVALHLGVRVNKIESKDDGSLIVHTSDAALDADIVLVAAGVRPNVGIAKAAGIKIGETGAIAVDDKMMTSVPDVYSAGDCAEQYNRLTGKAAYLPLGDTANKQGKIAGANIAGGNEKFAGILGSAGFKVFDLEVARTGLSQKEIADMGIKSVDAPSMHASVAHGMPGSQKIKTILSIDISNGKLLGAQSVGAAPVGKRVDVFATALYAGLTVNQIEELDLVYAPPISPVLDSILMAATVGKKALAKA